MFSRPLSFVSNLTRATHRFHWLRTFCEIKPNPALEHKPELTDEHKVDKLFTKVEIEVRGHDPAVLKSYMKFLVLSCSELNLKRSRILAPHYIRYHQNTLRDTFAHAKVKLHYEIRTHRRYITIYKVTGSTASAFLEYFQRNIPEGVAMKVTYEELRPMPKALWDLMEQNRGSTNSK